LHDVDSGEEDFDMRNRLTKLIGGAAVAMTMGLGALVAAPAPASAYTSIGIHMGWSGGYGFHNRHWNQYQPYYRAHVRPRHHPHWRGYRGGYYPVQAYRHNCRPIYRDYFRHGRVTRMGATQCIDRWGRPYIVRGSEFRIRHGHW